MATSRVEIHEEVIDESYGSTTDWRLCFHWVTYHYSDGSPSQKGYRFIWRRPDGSLQAARGQARIPSAAVLLSLLAQASSAGWFATVE